MNSINNHNYSPNFTSKVEILNLSKHADRLKKIAPLIEEKTQKFDKYFIDIQDGSSAKVENGTELFFYNNEGSEHTAIIPNVYLDKLLKKSDDFIAGKIAKLQRIFARRDYTIEEGNKFFNKIMKNDKYNDPANFEEKFYDALVEKCSLDQKEAVKRDCVLRSFDVWG
jgi:hypothetical protein